MNYTICKRCRGCESRDLVKVMSLGEQSLSCFPLNGESVPSGPLDLLFCRRCNLVQLGATYPPEWLYSWYGYKSGLNPAMVAALKDLADATFKTAHLLPGDVVCDVGSNDGTLLRQFPKGLFKVGFDPVKNFDPHEMTDGLDVFVPQRFSAAAWKAATGKRKARAVTAAAVFYALDDPLEFLFDVATILDSSGVLVIQMNHLGEMLCNNCFDNVVHEHVTYWSLSTLLPLLRRAGFRCLDALINSVNGGSLRVFAVPEGSALTVDGGERRIAELLKDETWLGYSATYTAVAGRVRWLGEKLRAAVEKHVNASRRVYVYGASTRGLTVMHYAGLDNRLIAGAAERNPDKWGRQYSDTGIVCVSEEEARKKADVFLCLPYQFLGHLVERERIWLERGGRFLVPLPEVREVAACTNAL